MKPIKETNEIGWTPQTWPGNPQLNLVCTCKLFPNPLNGKIIPVWIFGGTKEYQGFSFCVNYGANSAYSYTGRVEAHEIHKAQKEVDDLFKSKKLFK